MRLFHATLLALLLASPAGAMTSASDNPNSDDTQQNVQVYNEQNEKLGEAKLVILNDAGEPQSLVVKVNEIDASQVEVVVPVDRIRDATRNKKLVIRATRECLGSNARIRTRILAASNKHGRARRVRI
jgi:PRC-barrel domain